MHHCLGCKLYKAPAKVPGVSSNVEEWKLHLYRYLRVIHNLLQESRQYGIGWEGSDSSSDESSSSTGSWSLGNDSSSLFSRKMRSLLESEWGEELVGWEGSGWEGGPISAAHWELMEQSLAGGLLDTQDLCAPGGWGGLPPSWYFGTLWAIVESNMGVQEWHARGV